MIFGPIYEHDDAYELLKVMRLVELQSFKAALQTIMNIIADTRATCIDAGKLIEALDGLIVRVDEEISYIMSSMDYTEYLYEELEKIIKRGAKRVIPAVRT